MEEEEERALSSISVMKADSLAVLLAEWGGRKHYIDNEARNMPNTIQQKIQVGENRGLDGWVKGTDKRDEQGCRINGTGGNLLYNSDAQLDKDKKKVGCWQGCEATRTLRHDQKVLFLLLFQSLVLSLDGSSYR